MISLFYRYNRWVKVIWLSPLLPPLDGAQKVANAFEDDLVQYLSSYNLAPVQKIVDSFKSYDFSAIAVRLVASVPGRHKKQSKYDFGHFRMRKLLREVGENCDDGTGVEIGN